MASPPLKPPVLKAYLGAAREYLASDEPTDPTDPPPPLSDRLASLSTAYQTLLCLELAQRGVLVQGGAPFESSSGGGGGAGDVHSLFDAVTSTAGKALFDADTASLPKPLMAACSAVMAMAAERCADILGSIITGASNVKVEDLPANLLLLGAEADTKSSKRRCAEVEDGRLSSLLDLSQSLRGPKAATPDSPPPKTNEILLHLRRYRTIMLRLASGQYLRAAVEFSANDQPAMWKRCLDAVLKLNSALQIVARYEDGGDNNDNGVISEADIDEYSQYATLETVVPLSNLIRIASDKGNDKRASELGLRAAQSYLAGFDSLGGDVSNRKDGSDLSELSSSVKKIFWDEFLKKKSKENITTKSKFASLAQDAIGKIAMSTILSNADLSEVEKRVFRLLHSVLVLRSRVAVEEGAIDSRADHEWTAAKNRAEEKSGGVGRGGIAGLAKTKKQKALEEDLSRDRFVREATRSMLFGDDDDLGIDDAAVALRNELTQDFAEVVPKGGALVDSSFELMELQINRLTERARSIGLLVTRPTKKKSTATAATPKKWNQSDCDQAWASAASFSSPILIDLDECTVAAVSKRARHSICTMAIGVIRARWMTISVSDATAFEVDKASSILSKCKEMYAVEEKKEAAKRKRRGDDAIGASAPSKDLDRALQIDAALSSAQCRRALALASDDAELSKSIRSATATALKWEKKVTSKRQEEILGESGAPFLQLLLAWSGLHRSPFSLCTVTQARSIVRYAQESFDILSTVCGRVPTSLESVLLRLAKADVEGQLPGGYVPDGDKLYTEVFSSLGDSSCEIHENAVAIVKAHCLCGLSRIALVGIDSAGITQSAESYARDCLNALDVSFRDDTFLSEWRDPGFLQSSASFHVCTARQLVAESLLRESKPDEARQFLEEAVKGSPLDYDAAFALGAFRLRLVIVQGGTSSDQEKKVAQTQLLKAAKLNTNKADPFALLGIWYEKQADTKRAVGCYSKALLLDATHPVAGRGMLRMKPYEEIVHLCTAATSDTSPVNGWAWKAVGRSKAMDAGDDEMGAICLQQALRSRDISASSNESLAFFFPRADGDDSAPSDECAETWAELAFCYRRLGKYSASLRAYNSADESFCGEMLPPSVLCAWAHVELELGLFEDAVSRFEAVLEASTEPSVRPLASYGHGIAMVALSKTLVGEGKFGSALEHLLQGIQSVEALLDKEEDPTSSPSTSACSFKLLGDLYTLGASTPASLFTDKTDDKGSMRCDLDCCSHHDEETLSKLFFVSKGGDAYSKAMMAHKEESEESDYTDTSLLIAAASFDLGTNLLCQAQILATSLGEGTGGDTHTSMLDMLKKCKGIQHRIDVSIKHFRAAIESYELFAPAWCGIGSALCYRDVLLAQHCFCRAVQIDKTIADGWSSLGLIYADQNAASQASETLDALTQVADSPFMWIGRALLLEHDEDGNIQDQESNLSRASDAYRAALQVANHPEALLGLSVTARRLGLSKIMENQNEVYADSAHRAATRESHFALSMHIHLRGPFNAGARALDMVHRSEDAGDRLSTGLASVGKEIMVGGDSNDRLSIENTSKMLDQLSLDDPKIPGVMDGIVQASMTAVKAVEAVCDDASSLGDDAVPEEEVVESASLEKARLKVHLHPESGEYFLDFAKELTKQYTADASASTDGVRVASVAVDRAASLLLDEATNVHTVTPRRPIIIDHDGENGTSLLTTPGHDLSMHKNIVPRVVDADLVSESLALRAWIDLPAEVIASEAEDSAESSTEDAIAISEAESSLYSLQRSLLLDPENSMARCLLDYVCV